MHLDQPAEADTMTDHHIHIYGYEHGTRCWCGERKPLAEVIDLRSARMQREPRVEKPADCEDGGTAA